MNTEEMEDLATRLLVTETLMSYVIAQQAAAGAYKIDELQAFMTDVLSRNVLKSTEREDLSSKTKAHIDSAFSMASVFLQKIQHNPHEPG
jgi:hypothetical protein